MYLLIAGLVIAGWLAMFIGLRSALKRTGAELRLEFQRQMDSLSANVRSLERTADEPSAADAAAARAAQAKNRVTQASDEITPETLATIAETISALLSRKVHIRSVKILETPTGIANPWAQHGRAVIQASHNLAQQRRE